MVICVNCFRFKSCSSLENNKGEDELNVYDGNQDELGGAEDE